MEAVVADRELLTALARPDVLPRLASTRLFPAVCEQIVHTVRQAATSSRKQLLEPSSQTMAAVQSLVLQCPACQSRLAEATESELVGAVSSGPSTDKTAALLPLSLAHLVSRQLYTQAVHLVYSVQQTHQYMRSLPVGLVEVRARLRAALKEVAASSHDGEGRDREQREVLYEKALERMRDDRVGQAD